MLHPTGGLELVSLFGLFIIINRLGMNVGGPFS